MLAPSAPKPPGPPSVAEARPAVETPPEGTPRATAPALIVGRTYADAAVDIAKLLGRALPALLVAAGVVFGYLEYRKSVKEAEQSARAQFQKDLDAANAAMREAYRLSAEINGQMIGNAKTLIDLQTGMAITSGKTVQDLLLTKQSVVDETAKSAEARHQAESANAAKKQADRDVALAREEKSKVDLERASVLGELERLKEELQKSKDAVAAAASKRAEDIRYLRAQLEALVQQIQSASEADDASIPAAILERAKQIRGDVLVDPAKLLREFARAETNARPGYFDALVGVEVSALEAAITETDAFVVWVRISNEGGTGYVACSEQGSDRLHDLVVIGVENGRVVETHWFSMLAGTHLRDPAAWSDEDLWVIGGVDSEGRQSHAGVLIGGHSGPSWSLWDFIRAELSDDTGPGVDVMKGQVKDVAVVDWRGLERAFPDLYRAVSESGSRFADALDSNRRAASLDPTLSALAGLDRVRDESLRGRFIALLRGVVARDDRAVASLALRRLGEADLDQIAAAVLDGDFAVVGMRNPAETEQVTAQQAAAVDPNRVSIETEYSPMWEAERRVSFVFSRASADADWLLEELRVVVAPSREERGAYKK